MMDPLVVVSKIQKMMRDNLQRVGDARKHYKMELI